MRAGWFPGRKCSIARRLRKQFLASTPGSRITKSNSRLVRKFHVFEKFESNEKILTKITEKALFSGI
jgi:hypothetical protein